MRWVYLRRPALRWIVTALAMLALLAIALAALAVRRPSPTEPGSWRELALEAASSLPRYTLDLVFEPGENRLSGTLALDYANLESVPLDTLYFYIWPNSFSSLDYGVFVGEEEMAYPSGFNPGGIAIGTVRSGGAPLEYGIEGGQGQVLRVRLPEPVEPGGRASVTIEYAVTVPECLGRFGHGENTWSLVNAHPILAVCDADTGRWYKDYRYYSVGDPFYSDAADYVARIEVPPGYLVASTGSQTVERGTDAWITEVRGPAQRDFGFVVSDRFEVAEVTAGGVTVRSWYYCGDLLGERAARAAADAVAVFSRRFGGYCWDELDVVMCDFYVGGMEYPGMVLIDQSVYTLGNAMIMEMIVAHETGHQWWYAAVGSNQIEEPWMDEALTEFCTALYFEDNYPVRGREYRDRYVYGSYEILDAAEGYGIDIAQGAAIGSSVTGFTDNFDYSLLVYYRGALMFDSLREKIGEDAFYAALSAYYRKHLFGLAEGAELIAEFSRSAGEDLTDWFEEFLEDPFSTEMKTG